MAKVIAVEFERYGQLHYLNPGDHDFQVGDLVLYPTETGPEVCRVVWAPVEIDAEGFAELPLCQGRASQDDLDRDEANKQIRAEAFEVAKALIAKHELPMKVIGVDYVDRLSEFGHQVVIYFQAPGRVDFRALLGDLARSLRSRIDLRQIGSREVARILGGIGQCGQELCCVTWLDHFEPISMRIAKAQDLPPNPVQISGACGRLMCCLKFEHPMYVDFNRRAPAIGEIVETTRGTGRVVGHSVPSDSIDIKGDDGEVFRCPLAEVCSRARSFRELRQNK